MSKNLIPQIAQMLGLQLGEEFKVKGDNELIYRLTNDGLKLTHDSGIELADVSAKVAFAALLNGKDDIVKLPWKPKKGEKYYSFDFTCKNYWIVDSYVWLNSPRDYALLGKGWVYRTEAEAEAALPKVAAEFDVKYKL